MKLTFVELSQFTLTAEDVIDDVELRAVEDELLLNPEAGALVAGTGGVRKVRVAIEGRGKSGGARILYYYVPHRAKIFLILVYAKGQASTITPSGKKIIRAIAAEIDKE